MPYPDTLVFRSDGPRAGMVCAPMFLTAKEIVAETNAMSPPSIRRALWCVDSSEKPEACPFDSQRVHYALTC